MVQPSIYTGAVIIHSGIILGGGGSRALIRPICLGITLVAVSCTNLLFLCIAGNIV